MSKQKIFCYYCYDGKIISSSCHVPYGIGSIIPSFFASAKEMWGSLKMRIICVRCFLMRSKKSCGQGQKCIMNFKNVTIHPIKIGVMLITSVVTQFGIHPSLFAVGTIHFDAFHLICSIICQIMGFIHGLVLTQSSDLKADFTEQILQKN